MDPVITEVIRLQNELALRAVELQQQKRLKKLYREELESVREKNEQLEKDLRITCNTLDKFLAANTFSMNGVPVKKKTTPTIIVENGGTLTIKGTGHDYTYSIK